jgi:uncharacterized repeat protein (TIGR01451 family)
MPNRTALVVLTIALCATLALGTDFSAIDKPDGGLKDHPTSGSAVGVTWVDVGDAPPSPALANDISPNVEVGVDGSASTPAPSAINDLDAAPVGPLGGSEDATYVDIIFGTGGNQWPWSTALGTSVHFQMMYRASNINKAGAIESWAWQCYSATASRVFNNVTIKMCHTTLANLTTDMIGNFGGNTPVTVGSYPSVTIGGCQPGQWMPLNCTPSFQYNGTDNLLIDITWQSANAGGPTWVRFGQPGYNGRCWVWNWSSNTASFVDGMDYNVRLGFEPDLPDLASIAGTAFSDDDGDGERDPGERGLPAWTVRLDPGPRYALTNADGEYRFYSLLAGEYTVSEVMKTYWRLTYPPSPGVHVVTLDEGEEVTGKDFGNQLYVFIQDLGVSVAGGIARPGFQKTYAIRYQNTGTVEADATVVLVLPPEVSYVSSSPPGSYDAGTHSVTWDVGSVPASFTGYLSAIVQIPVVPIGTKLTALVTIEPQIGDADTTDNFDTEIEVVRGSYDPNMITVRPEPYIEAGDELDCTIYFQNVGNDTAFNIVVRDVLDPGLDVATVEPLAASHPYAFGLGEPNELTWWFNDIKLVDKTTNEPASQGFLRFRIHTYANLTPGTYVDNSAAIYFDYNEPVQTNTVRLTVVIFGWSAQTPMPLPPSNKEVDAGGWLAYDPGSQFIYAAKGNKTADFYRYIPATDAWQTLASWPDGSERDRPTYGSAGCAADDGVIYATKGSNTLGFWMYDAAKDSWYQKADVPLGPDSLKVKGGADIVWVGSSATGHAYLLKGHKNEFYRYHPDGDYWEALADAPSGPNRKWDKGSWLAYDGANTIYAHRADYNELYAYDVASGVWSAPLAGMPFVGRSGKNEKSGDGGCGTYLDGCIYALKGGKTQECWKYTIATNSWSEEGSMPLGPQDETVGPGADIVAAGAKLFATKGNKCNELWQYLSASFNTGSSPLEGTQAVETAVAADLSVGPNPLASGFAVLRYGLPKGGAAELSVYNVAGQRVMTKTLVLGRSGSVSLDLRQLAGGVYLVKLHSQDFCATQKLVVQR